MSATWPLRSLLQDPLNGPIGDAPAWQRRAAHIRSVFEQTIGPRPASQKLHRFSLDESHRADGIGRQLVRIVVDEDDVMEAWLLEPAERDAALSGRVALALHPTNESGKDETAGLDTNMPHRAYGLELARRGWTVLVPDHMGIERRYSRGLKRYDTTRFYQRFGQWTMVGKMIADAQICVDLLQRLPQTQGKEIAVIGHSLGGHGAILLAAADQRVHSVVCNCGLFPFANGPGCWFRDEWAIYFPDGPLKQSVLSGPGPLWDWHELTALIAPRRLLLIMTLNDYCGGTLETYTSITTELHRVWELLGAHGNLTCVLHNEGHVFERWHREMAYNWLEYNRSTEADRTLRDIASKELHVPSPSRY